MGSPKFPPHIPTRLNFSPLMKRYQISLRTALEVFAALGVLLWCVSRWLAPSQVPAVKVIADVECVGVVLPHDHPDRITWTAFPPTWTPTIADARLADRAIRESLSSTNAKEEDIPKHLIRQFYGATVEDRRVIVVVYIADDFIVEQESQSFSDRLSSLSRFPVYVGHENQSLFDVIYDVRSGECTF